jgi:hypothetical protein
MLCSLSTYCRPGIVGAPSRIRLISNRGCKSHLTSILGCGSAILQHPVDEGAGRRGWLPHVPSLHGVHNTLLVHRWPNVLQRIVSRGLTRRGAGAGAHLEGAGIAVKNL